MEVSGNIHLRVTAPSVVQQFLFFHFAFIAFLFHELHSLPLPIQNIMHTQNSAMPFLKYTMCMCVANLGKGFIVWYPCGKLDKETSIREIYMFDKT